MRDVVKVGNDGKGKPRSGDERNERKQGTRK